MLPSSTKASVVQKVETLRKECESKRRQLVNMKVQVERNDLLGGAAVFEMFVCNQQASRELKRQMEDQLTTVERQNVYCE